MRRFPVIAAFAVLGAQACVTKAITPGVQDTDDVGVDDTEVVADTVVEDTEDTPGEDTFQFETGLVVDTDRGGMPSNLSNLDCHAWDPMSYTGWTRKYRYKGPGGGTGVETHTAVGWSDVPDVQAVVAQGNAWEVELTGLPSQNYKATYWSTCTGRTQQGEAQSVAYQVTADGKTVKAGAQTAEKYLPEEVEFWGQFAPSWNSQTKYKIKVPVPRNPLFPTCSREANGTRSVDAQFTGIGFETINVTGLGTVEAYHLNVVLNQTQTVNLSACQQINPLAFFVDAFSAAFGGISQSSDGSFVTASIDRWYVRGVGLVKETAIDFTTAADLYSKTLTSCSGLPDCP